MSPIKITVDQEYVENLINSRIDDLLNQDLSGITWSLDEFRKKCCGNKSKEWVALYIFSEFSDEITGTDGWLIPSQGRGSKNIIFAKAAKEWMEENRQRIDWRAKLPR